MLPRSRSTGSRPGRSSSDAAGKLIVCPTPIGNVEDITLRVLAALREADLIACEDTRRTGTLLKNYGVSGKLVSYYEQNEKSRAAELVKRMHDGEVVALVSDAGMPLVSDPGFVLVRALRRRRPRGRGAARAVRRAGGAGRQRAAGRPLALCRVPAAQAQRAARRRSSLRRRWSRSSRRAASRTRWRCWPRLDPKRPVAVCRELDQGARGGRTRPRRRARRALRQGAAAGRGRAGRRPSTRSDRRRPGPALEAVRKLVESGAKPRVAAHVVADLTGASANKLYKALTG